MAFSLVSIEDNSLAYIHDQLEHGRGLAQLVRRRQLGTGTVHALLPSSDPSLATGYANGALRDTAQEEDAVTAVAQHLVATYGLTADVGMLLICQFADGAQRPPERGPQDSFEIARPYSTAWLHGADQAYQDGELWYADSRTELAGVVAMLDLALWFPAVGVLTMLPDDTVIADREPLAYDRLWPLVRDAHVILIGAWDAMNYLLWTPREPASRGAAVQSVRLTDSAGQ